jgi:hypothetical protein
VLALLLVAGSLGLNNFAASIAIGLSGLDRAARARVTLTFGLFEAEMPVIGLLIGRGLSHALGLGGAHRRPTAADRGRRTGHDRGRACARPRAGARCGRTDAPAAGPSCRPQHRQPDRRVCARRLSDAAGAEHCGYRRRQLRALACRPRARRPPGHSPRAPQRNSQRDRVHRRWCRHPVRPVPSAPPVDARHSRRRSRSAVFTLSCRVRSARAAWSSLS